MLQLPRAAAALQRAELRVERLQRRRSATLIELDGHARRSSTRSSARRAPPPTGTSRGPTPSCSSLKAPGNNYFASVGSSLEFAGRSRPAGRPTARSPTSARRAGSRRIARRPRRHEQHGRLRRMEDRRRHRRARSSIQDIVFVGSFPRGTARNNGDAEHAQPALVANFLPWLQPVLAGLAGRRRPHGQDPRPWARPGPSA